MGYFSSEVANVSCSHYRIEWEEVVKQIRGWPPVLGGRECHLREEIGHHLEAKALYVFTLGRRLVSSAARLADRADGGWHEIFIEATCLLFPMVELVGCARLDTGQVWRHYPNQGVPSAACLWAGFQWLRDPGWIPVVSDNKLKHETQTLEKDRWEIGHLIALRNYFLHGSKEAKDRRGTVIDVWDIMSFELPRVLIERAKCGMRRYWSLLKLDDGNQGWVQRLADADIRPLVIEGSGFFERGLVDHSIVDYLEE